MTAIVLIFAAGVARPCEAADLELFATGAVLFDEPISHLEMIELRGQPAPHVAFGSAVVHVSTGHSFDEMQLRGYASFSVNTGAWAMESRHLVSFGDQTEFRYRHRLRVIHSALSGRRALSLRAYDEYFADLNGRGTLRNVLAIGTGIALGETALAEIYHAWSEENHVPDTRYWLLVLSWRMK